MSEPEQSERLVPIHHAANEWEGNIVIGYLHDNGIEATLRTPPSVPPLDVAENLTGTNQMNSVFVLEQDAERARSLLQEFQSTETDQQMLEETAAQKVKPDKKTIAELRAAVREERKTFEFLGWVGVAFLGAAAILWAIWPAWLKLAPPQLQWIIVLLFAFAALFAGSWASRRLK
ncbi:MAG TPA: hypothetical protein VL171_16195 [Verrucomicrobiae bacterium]|nr:hypothetical protein [Verrucomicrobiae bacterium]